MRAVPYIRVSLDGVGPACTPEPKGGSNLSERRVQVSELPGGGVVGSQGGLQARAVYDPDSDVSRARRARPSTSPAKRVDGGSDVTVATAGMEWQDGRGGKSRQKSGNEAQTSRGTHQYTQYL